MEILSPHGELVRAIAKRELIAVFGTGISVSATNAAPAASWTGLLRKGIEFCSNYHQPPLPREWASEQTRRLDAPTLDNILAAASEIEVKLKETGRYNLFFLRTVGELRIQNSSMIEAVQVLASAGVIIATTNYDGLIEEATGLPAVSWRNGAMTELVLSGEVRGIVHLHGWWWEPESVVLGTGSYDAILRDALEQATQRSLAQGRRLVFIGYGEGLDDPNFGALRRWMQETLPASGRFHFRLCRQQEFDALQRRHADEERVVVLPYGDDYADLTPFVKGLVAEPHAPAALHPLTPAAQQIHAVTFEAECIPDEDSVIKLVRANPSEPTFQWHESVQSLIDRVEGRFARFDQFADSTIPWIRETPERRQYLVTSSRARLHQDLQWLRRVVGAAPQTLTRTLGVTRGLNAALRQLAVRNLAAFTALAIIRRLQMFDQHVFEPGDPPVPFHSIPSLRVPEWLIDLMPARSPLGDYVFHEDQFLRARIGETEDSYEYVVMPRFLADSLHRSGDRVGEYAYCAWVLPQWLLYSYELSLDPQNWKVWVLKDAGGREAYFSWSPRPWEQ